MMALLKFGIGLMAGGFALLFAGLMLIPAALAAFLMYCYFFG
ncbi:hypothetical protein AB7813_08200 [Tardiphaga sp. 20_F10_N6_6]